MDWIREAWPHLIGAVVLLAALTAGVHALLYKRDSRAALLWMGLIWLAPVLGPLLYYVFGINRVRRRALTLRTGVAPLQARTTVAPCSPDQLGHALPADLVHLKALDLLVEQVVRRPLLPGNRITPLLNGDEAYPAMLEAIAGARASITLCSYIFDHDRAGLRFVDALGAAERRGVAVRVLIDDAGARYSFPVVRRALRRAGVPVAHFNPRFRLLPRSTLNLRTHRKLCVVDGRIGFTGGLNIRRGNLLADPGRHPVQDLHFRLDGPVVGQIQAVFAEDWAFTTGEPLEGDAWFPSLDAVGGTLARGIADGPDEAFDKLRWSILGAIGIARKSVQVVTPYFIPDAALIAALNVAAMRGVTVDLLLPERGNVALAHWAMRAMLWQVLERGCRVWFTPPPFDHTKLMVVDGHWTLLGSANWDPRSLRLNFEFNVEAYDAELGGILGEIIAARQGTARRATLDELDSRRLPVRMRDGVARLFSPLL